MNTDQANTPDAASNRLPGYISYASPSSGICAICSQPNQSPGAIAFVNSSKVVCQSCLSQIQQLLQANAFLPFWD